MRKPTYFFVCVLVLAMALLMGVLRGPRSGMDLNRYLVENAILHGAKGDGSTDDTLAIQACIDAAGVAAAANLAPATCFLPCGVYDIGHTQNVGNGIYSALRMNVSNTSLVGENVNCVELNADFFTSTGGAHILNICGGDPVANEACDGTQLDGIVVSDISFVDNNPEDHCTWTATTETCTGEESHGIAVDDVTDVQLTRLRISGIGDEGITIAGTSEGMVIDSLECDGHPGIADGGGCLVIKASEISVFHMRCHGQRDEPVGTCSDSCPNGGSCLGLEAFSSEGRSIRGILVDDFRSWDNEGNRSIYTRETSDGHIIGFTITNSIIDHEGNELEAHLEAALGASTTGSTSFWEDVSALADWPAYDIDGCLGPANPYTCCTGADAGTCPTAYENGDCTGAGTPYACCTGPDAGTCIPARIDDEDIMIAYCAADQSDCAGPNDPCDCCSEVGTGNCAVTMVDITDRGVAGTTDVAHLDGSEMRSMWDVTSCDNEAGHCALQIAGNNGIENFKLLNSTINGRFRANDLKNGQILGNTFVGHSGIGVRFAGDYTEFVGNTVRSFMEEGLLYAGQNVYGRVNNNIFIAVAHDSFGVNFGGAGVTMVDFEFNYNNVMPRSTSSAAFYSQIQTDGTMIGNLFDGGGNAPSGAQPQVYGGARLFMGNTLKNQTGNQTNGGLYIRGDNGLYMGNKFYDTPQQAVYIRGVRNTVVQNDFWRVDDGSGDAAFGEHSISTYSTCDYNRTYGKAIIVDQNSLAGGTPAAGDDVSWNGAAQDGTVVAYSTPLITIIPDDVTDDTVVDDTSDITDGVWTATDVDSDCASCQAATEGATIACSSAGSTNANNSQSPTD